ncbi:MAG: hypothetical protein MZV63_45660 [Marinilabiliales bacterium]|nr:hypothetical protein [Marinilabiliales bacterium]
MPADLVTDIHTLKKLEEAGVAAIVLQIPLRGTGTPGEPRVIRTQDRIRREARGTDNPLPKFTFSA